MSTKCCNKCNKNSKRHNRRCRSVNECIHDNQRLFRRRFADLWQILSFTGESFNKGSGTIKEFPTQPLPVSHLVGTSFLTDPSSPVRVLGYTIDNFNGPIDELRNSFAMITYNNLVSYKISYKVRDLNGKIPKFPVKIGFYTSNLFLFNQSNRLILICGNKGPSLFNANSDNNFKGSFKCSFINYIYAAVDADVKVILKVKTIIPKIVVIPNITPTMPYIEFTYLCGKKFPVAKTTTKNIVSLFKKPTHCFKKISQFIQKYLDDTSLSITLFNDIPTPSLTNLLDQTSSLEYKFFYTNDSSTTGVALAQTAPRITSGSTSYVTIVTNNLPNKGQYWIVTFVTKNGATISTNSHLVPIGIELPAVSMVRFFKVTYSVTMTIFSAGSLFAYKPSVDLQGLYARGWDTFANYDENGKEIGKTSSTFGTKVTGNSINLQGSFIISSNVAAFNLTAYTNSSNLLYATFPTDINTPPIKITIDLYNPPS